MIVNILAHIGFWLMMIVVAVGIIVAYVKFFWFYMPDEIEYSYGRDWPFGRFASGVIVHILLALVVFMIWGFTYVMNS